MRVTVLYFGILKDLFSSERESYELQDQETVEGLLRLLRGRTSKQSDAWKILAVAVNGSYVRETAVLRDSDEVALLPPVSGGIEEEYG